MGSLREEIRQTLIDAHLEFGHDKPNIRIGSTTDRVMNLVIQALQAQNDEWLNAFTDEFIEELTSKHSDTVVRLLKKDRTVSEAVTEANREFRQTINNKRSEEL